MKLKRNKFSAVNSVMRIIFLLMCFCLPWANGLLAKENNISFIASVLKDRIITGTVKGPDGVGIPGAGVIVKGTNVSVITDNNGKFSIKVVDNNAVLVVTTIGFKPQEVIVGNSQILNINLQESSNELKEVTINVGYGTQKKVTSVGAQSSISTKDLTQSPVANISNSLAGRLPGLFAVQASGEPGADNSQIFIRGVSTFTGSTSPLVLVDGIQVDNFNSIDPNEIEGVTILKDASTTAVYGVRGANGVILVTTKRGKIGTPTINYTFENAFNSFTATPEKMGSFDFANSFNQALKNDAYVSNSTYTPRYSDSDLAKYKSGEDPVFFPNIDWYDLMVKDVSQQRRHNLSVRGGTDKVKYAISAGLFNQEGLFDDAGVKADYDPQIRYGRYNFRSNLDYTISKRFRAALDLSSIIENRSGNNANTNSIMNFLNGAAPNLSPGVVDGKIVLFEGFGSPLTTLYSVGYKNDVRNLINGSLRLDHDLDFITKGLTSHALIAYQNSNRKLSEYSRVFVTYRAIKNPDGTIDYRQLADNQPFNYNPTDPERNRRITGEFAIDYKRTFNSHTVSGLLLYNQIKSTNRDFAYLVPNSYQSYVSRLDYDYKGRYLAQISASYYGTENFAPSERFGFFPAYSIGWVPSEEKFFPKGELINFLKIRGSYGEVGNDQLSANFLRDPNSRFLYRDPAFTRRGPYTVDGSYRFGVFGQNLASYEALREGSASSPNLTWERVIKTNIGVDLVGLNNKLTVTLDAFNTTTDNILAVPRTVSALTGIGAAAENLGKMTNKGFEVEMGFRNNIRDFNYFIKGNYSFARNKIIFQDELPQTFAYAQRTGNIAGQNFGFIAEGFFNTWEETNDQNRPQYTFRDGNRIQPGDVRYRDVNGDGLINNDDSVPIGYSSTVPEIIFGLSVGGSWRGLDFSALFQGASHFSVPYTRRANQAFFDGDPSAAASYLSESWTQERYEQGLPISFPRFGVGNGARGFNNYLGSTLWIANAEYLRLKNVEIGYTLKPSLLSKVGLKTTRIYLNANNLITWSHMLKGIDPEAANLTSINGNFEAYGLVRTVNLGINVNF
ncbi:SusC/RagA family TonB-linked outer membrane protein [Pedobacter psychroterrae]|uniref:TonB-dependent receptor n=1 Tax=Pedobacter psychroterrae TaxID=2530453 RepID=A0A4R0NLN8_9SPHI|nr:TonB-dependent receptor [Pedobacter psychroterrae]TCD01556.1 TonB-dependent receptor [Pedobacter psychroterrae]